MDYFEEIKKLVESGQLNKAITVCKKWCGEEPDNHKTWYNLGTIFYMDGDTNAAEKALKRSIEIDSNYVYSLSNLGSVYCCKKKFRQAIPFFEKARSLAKSENDKSEILSKLADAHLNCEQYKNASLLIGELYKTNEELAMTLEGKMIREVIPCKSKPKRKKSKRRK
jgi:tetratricopeptide (TPR) repeat protein